MVDGEHNIAEPRRIAGGRLTIYTIAVYNMKIGNGQWIWKLDTEHFQPSMIHGTFPGIWESDMIFEGLFTGGGNEYGKVAWTTVDLWMMDVFWGPKSLGALEESTEWKEWVFFFLVKEFAENLRQVFFEERHLTSCGNWKDLKVVVGCKW
jgi:hypothetical protein